MSLDFYLEAPPAMHTCHACGHEALKSQEVFWRNITHNVNTMAKHAGIYDVLWHPNDKGQVTAKDITPALKAGLSDLLNRPEYFKKFNPANGWGSYDGFVAFVQNALKACEANPDALVRVSI